MCGYLHKTYAESLSEFGEPLNLPKCGGWLLKRRIPACRYYDAMGCYPIFLCRDWSQVSDDLEGLKNKLVSVTLVTDPFGNYKIDYLKKHFDRVIEFKKHYVIDLSKPSDLFIKRSHQESVRRALRKVHIEICPEPISLLDKWEELYANLVNRHNITGIQRFSKKAFSKQLTVPGIVMFKATFQGTLIGVDIWYVNGEVGYGHLVALSDLGYKLRAAYALKWHLINYFAGKVRWLDLGGAAGTRKNNYDGLVKFKIGWSTGVRTVYLCGKILNHDIYQQLKKKQGSGETDYFPAYRKGEFNR